MKSAAEFSTGDPNKNAIFEIAQILAAGLTRVLARKSRETSAENRECSLDFSPPESGHTVIRNPENSA